MLHVQFVFLLIRSIDLDAIFIAVPFYGDVTRYDSQRLFLAQHSVAMLEQFATIRNNVAITLQSCVALKIVVANRTRVASPLAL